MKNNIIKVITAIVMSTMLLAGCEKASISENLLVGTWELQQESTLPSVCVEITADGMAHFNIGPGCFGIPITLSYQWSLIDQGNKVHFKYLYNSNGTEELRPDVEWKLKEVSNNKLVVKEKQLGTLNEETTICTYNRIYLTNQI